MNRRPIHLVAVASITMLAACGGGGGSGGDGSVLVPVPTSIEEAVQQQSAAAAQIKSLVEELINAENAASDALDDERYTDFDAWWRDDYPDWVERFSDAADRFAQTEQSLVMLALTEQAQSTSSTTSKSGGDDPENAPAKVVPLPIVLLAVATITAIAVKERERLAQLNDGVDEAETQAIIDARAAYLRARQGLNEIQARTRATVDVGQVEILRGLKNGIEHARQFASEQAVGFFSEYLPEPVKDAIGLADDSGKLLDIRDNVTVLLSDPACASSAPQQSAVVPAKALEEFPVCRLHICDAGDLQCSEVPLGDWAASLYSDAFLRDEDEVDVQTGTFNGVEFTLFTAAEADAARNPGNGGNSDEVDFSRISNMDFGSRVLMDGTVFDAADASGRAETRTVRISAIGTTQLSPAFDCPRLAGLPPVAYVFQNSTSTPSSSREEQVAAIVDSATCLSLEQGSAVFDGVSFGTGNSQRSEEFAQLSFAGLTGNVIRDSTGTPDAILYRVAGPETCAALDITDFDYVSRIEDLEFVGENLRCDNDSFIELRLFLN